jgi:hypothetical protein
MLISKLFQVISSNIQSVFTICIALILASFIWSLWVTLQKGLMHLQRLHQIPCHRCVFFTGEYYLKCTIHPSKALNEEAINCRDYQSIRLNPAP